MRSAVVLGGGFAGMLMAGVLARHVPHVTVLEAGRYPTGPDVRAGVPQAHHSHVLVTGGAVALETLLPGTLAALAEAGAHQRGLSGDALILSAQGWFPRHETDAYLISSSRWLTDHVLRKRVLAGGTVAVRENIRVRALTGDATHVTGVLVDAGDGRVATIAADLVVDATGRRSRAPRWLAGLGCPPVPEEVVDPGLAYATRFYRAPAGLGANLPAIMVHPQPGPDRPGYGATLFPIEDNRFVVTLTGTRGDRPPADEQGFAAAAGALRSPIVAELMAAGEPLGDVRPYHATSNRRRFFERSPRPDGFLVVGDALVALNPFYSHGMSVAALSALRLDRELTRGGAGPAELSAAQHAMAAEADGPWTTATEQDRPRGGAAGVPAAFEQLVRDRLARTTVSSPQWAEAMFRAQTLIAPVPAGAVVPAPAPADGRPLDEHAAVAQYPHLAAWRRTLAGSTT
ncbi:NAD(P)/FAD-dependent oxidoreductase [Actinoplanes sp. NPDC051859]|uniref:NAD(P)/FAD-dependent oxidoreductase n=1 Tax=Actinoplanes sp. NPDC051859 TaxID=3363909 RepID=UPI0037AC65D6